MASDGVVVAISLSYKLVYKARELLLQINIFTYNHT